MLFDPEEPERILHESRKEYLLCRNMYVSPADMFMILQRAIRITGLLRVQHLKIFRMTGHVRYAEYLRMSSYLNNR